MNNGHEHEHICEHDHEHEHVYNYTSCGDPEKYVHITEHEGAFVLSTAFTKEGSLTVLERELTKQIQELSAALEAKGALIGHIKGIISQNNISVISSTGMEPIITKKTMPQCQIRIVVIVLDISKQDLTDVAAKNILIPKNCIL